MHGRLLAIGVLALSGIIGCTTGPAPIVIHEDRTLSVWLKFDPIAGAGHRHPTEISSARMAALLGGLRVVPRNALASLFGAAHEGDPVFTPAEASRLAPLLSQAFLKASPRDMVTFYLLGGDRATGSLVTSGGLVSRNGYLYVIVANARTSPDTRIYETSHEVDTRDDPILPLARFNFLVKFIPPGAEIPKSQARDPESTERYVDPAKVVVIDLAGLPESRELSKPTSTPSVAPPAR